MALKQELETNLAAEFTLKATSCGAGPYNLEYLCNNILNKQTYPQPYFIAYMMNESGLFSSGANDLGAITIKIATYKVGLSFSQAFYLGIMCNWLVCLAVWMATGAKDISGKIWAIFFPIWLFITSGFEHSIANMYYIPAGIFAKGNPQWVNAAMNLGVSAEKIAELNWESFLIQNLLPVTLGNIVGGALFVGGIYWFVYHKNTTKKS